MFNTEAPAAMAPKANGSFIRFEAFPQANAGPNIMTVVAYNFIKDYVFEDMKTKKTRTADAIEFFFGTIIEGKPYFVKTWPKTYSIDPKAWFTKLYKAATGADPKAGCTPKEVIGKGVTLTIKVEEKKSQATGNFYTATSIEGHPSAVHPKLIGEVVGVSALLPHLEAAVKASSEKKEGDGNTY